MNTITLTAGAHSEADRDQLFRDRPTADGKGGTQDGGMGVSVLSVEIRDIGVPPAMVGIVAAAASLGNGA